MILSLHYKYKVIMTEPIIINNPSEKVLELFELMRLHKARQLDKMKDMKRGIFSIKV